MALVLLGAAVAAALAASVGACPQARPVRVEAREARR